MNRGVLIFAHDNGDTPYTDLAAWSAQRIRRHLDLPVCLVTDVRPKNSHQFDHVVISDAEASSHRRQFPWRNHGRFRAGELSPYDETLLLDADYVVCSDQLATLFDCDHDIVSMRWAYDITSLRTYDNHNFFGRHRMPSAWATVVYWRRSTTAQQVFDMMGLIQQHWKHYADLYGLTDRKFRNDFALAIASNTVMGHTGHWPQVPWGMANLETGCDLRQLDPDSFEIGYLDQQQKSRRITIRGMDFHAMNKKPLEALIETAG